MQRLPISSISQKDGGTQIKLIVDFEVIFYGIFKSFFLFFQILSQFPYFFYSWFMIIQTLLFARVDGVAGGCGAMC